jgi:hypothetical protein
VESVLPSGGAEKIISWRKLGGSQKIPQNKKLIENEDGGKYFFQRNEGAAALERVNPVVLIKISCRTAFFRVGIHVARKF